MDKDFMNTFTYQYVDFPPVPEKFVQEALLLRDADYSTRLNQHNSQEEMKYRNRNIKNPDGDIEKAPYTGVFHISDQFRQWVNLNIGLDYGLCGASVTQGTAKRMMPHVDFFRSFILIYVIDTGGDEVDTVWYKQRGDYPAYRPDLKYNWNPDSWITDYSQLEEIDRVRSPAKTWMYFNGDILHSVENITRSRISIQLSRSTPLHDNIMQCSDVKSFDNLGIGEYE
jgi:hypothetical protein